MIGLRRDTEADAMYIELTTAEWDETEEVEDGTYVYLDARGDLIGIEVHHPDRSWPIEEVLSRYTVSEQAAQQLRAYFAQPALLPPPAHPSTNVPVTVAAA